MALPVTTSVNRETGICDFGVGIGAGFIVTTTINAFTDTVALSAVGGFVGSIAEIAQAITDAENFLERVRREFSLPAERSPVIASEFKAPSTTANLAEAAWTLGGVTFAYKFDKDTGLVIVEPRPTWSGDLAGYHENLFQAREMIEMFKRFAT